MRSDCTPSDARPKNPSPDIRYSLGMTPTSRLHSLLIQGCRSIVGPVKIDFPDNGLVLVKGTNADTGGGSGCGKTSFLLSLAYALGYSPVPATELQNWDDGAPQLQTIIDIGTQNGLFSLHRGAKNMFYGLDGSCHTSASAIKAELKKVLGLPPNLLEALTYRGQMTRSLFLSMKDDEKKEFLVDCIPELAPVEKAAEVAEESAKKMLADLQAEEALLATLRQDFENHKTATLPPVLHDLAPFELKVEEKKKYLESKRQRLREMRVVREKDEAVQAEQLKRVRERYRPKSYDLNVKLDRIKGEKAPQPDDSNLKKLLAQQSECEFRLKKAKQADVEGMEQYGEESRRLQNEEVAYKRRIEEGEDAQQVLRVLRRDLELLHEHECPTCHQRWVDNVQKARELERDIASEQKIVEEAEQAKEKLAKLQEHIANRAPYVGPVIIPRLESVAQKLINDIATEKANLRSTVQRFDAERVVRENEVLKELAKVDEELRAAELAVPGIDREHIHLERLIEQEVEEAATALRTVQEECNGHLRDNTIAQSLYDRALVELKKKHDQVATQQAKVEDLSAAYREEADLAELLGNSGFLGAIFDEILHEIATEANSILAAVPNTSHIQIRFRSEKLTQKGVSKRVIMPVVTLYNKREVPFKTGISGGQQTAVELAVDLAVGLVVGRRTGVMPGWLVLDEAFTGLGMVEKEVCMEILAKYAEDRLVLIVDHDNQFKEMFAKTIELRFENGVTTVAQ